MYRAALRPVLQPACLPSLADTYLLVDVRVPVNVMLLQMQ